MIRFVIFLFSISMFSQGYETQKYEVVKTLGDIELRFYPPAMKAKVSAGGNFSRLFKYISGNNEQGEKISLYLYLTMGWLIIVKIDDLTRLISNSGLILIVLSGVLYSIGTFFYSSKTIKYSHAIWHLFVMAGSITHYFFVLYFIVQ